MIIPGKFTAENRLIQALEERFFKFSLRRLRIPEPGLADFTSNDYLGLAHSGQLQQLVAAETDQLRASGITQLLGSCGSRLLSGNSAYAENLEAEFAAFYKSQAGLIFNSGYAANLSLFGSVPQRGDFILYDELIHASVRDGIRLSNAKSWSFRHNDMDDLESLLKKTRESGAGQIYVAAEAIYSMDGDRCPLEELVRLTTDFDAALILDEAHSNGICGEHGEGLAVEKNLQDKIFARLLTFGKAAGCHGAFVAGSKILREYLINFGRSFIYSTALPVHDLVVMKCAKDIFSGMHAERKKLESLVLHFQTAMNLHAEFTSPIRALIIPGNEEVKKVADACREQKLDVRAVLSPTVPAGKERLRTIFHAFNSESEVDQLIKTVAGGALS
jgi:8-amino-7-oxononanoate synthase